MQLVRPPALDDARSSTCLSEWRGADRQSAPIRDLLEHASGLPARSLDAPPATRAEFEPRHLRDAARILRRARGRFTATSASSCSVWPLAAARWRARWPCSSAQLWLARRLDLRSATRSEAPRRADAADGRGFPRAAAGSSAKFTTTTPPHWAASPATPACSATAPAVGGIRADRAGGGARRRRNRRRSLTLVSPSSSTRSHGAGQLARARVGHDARRPRRAARGCRRTAFGHVGFTGTSLWIDPSRDRYFVLLTNRACGGGSLDADADGTPGVSRRAR